METQITKQHMVKVTNRNNGVTGYTLSNGFRRQFHIGQTRSVDLEELKELSAIPGGEYILKNFLIINDQAALDYLDIPTEPEYFYTEKEIKTLLENGSLDQLEDCLNFAPQGVIDLIKSISIQIELPDTRKRKMILEKTGFSVDNALLVNATLSQENDTEKEEKPQSTRKAAPIEKVEKPVRKYNVISKQE